MNKKVCAHKGTTLKPLEGESKNICYSELWPILKVNSGLVMQWKIQNKTSNQYLLNGTYAVISDK